MRFFGRSLTLVTLWTALLALAAPACSGDGGAPAAAGAPAADWPAGTVLAVGALPISAADVDQDSATVVHLALESSDRDLRRKALMNLTLPRTVARALAGERWDEVRREAQAALERARRGETADLPERLDLEGGYGSVGLALWGAALETPIGTWTPLVEEGGAFRTALVVARAEHRIAAGTTVELEELRFPYLDDPDPAVAIEAAKDDLVLVIVDPEWRRVVPELTQYRMGVHE